MARALVTGSQDRVVAVAAVLAEQGIDVVTASVVTDLDGADLSGLDHYIQLPVFVEPEGDNLVGRVRSFLSAGLISRYTFTERVLPALNPGAHVVIVSGSSVRGDLALPDDRSSRLALLHVLAHAVRAETGDRQVEVSIISGARNDADVVAHAIGATSASRTHEQAETVTAKQYQDWRTEIMGFTTGHV
ncbi:hypothetical protein [Pseudonocardia endophytica]|uniref:Uncharacterized protein n=1 Tax=Pseudonocardia endophytica TaxID=401976 RepID=A0A4R1HQL6_PSEEN|nr:hypothetical protein [Pseudonocardia endophytica]TCK24857.1 hypothetical protein EV378_0650 [Pseudonocardia endophytica]